MLTNRIFFDTNVVLDIIDTNRAKHVNAVMLWENLVREDYQIFISEDMLSTIFYINKNNKKYTLEFLKLILKRWQVVSFLKDIIGNAIDLSLEKDLDLEDVLQCLCAKAHGCDVFITNDKKFYDCGIKIMSSEEKLFEISQNFNKNKGNL